ncbi:hypothetical protein GCM10010246_57480 [Streptomyces cuspidosporus]|uniref:Uncharacterized protein n=1 Tax=Streptomyces cuspidosporus TaxID=66882 RepID=A0ABN3GT90_9ACTN
MTARPTATTSCEGSESGLPVPSPLSLCPVRSVSAIPAPIPWSQAARAALPRALRASLGPYAPERYR